VNHCKEKNQNVIEANEKKNIENVKTTNTNFVNCAANGGKTTINCAYHFSDEYLKAAKNEPIDELEALIDKVSF